MDSAFTDIGEPAPSIPKPEAAKRAKAAWQRAKFQIAIILTIGACVTALVWAILTVEISTERRAAIRAAQTNGGNLSAAFQTELNQNLTAVARAMDAVAERMRAAHGAFDIYDWAKEIPVLSTATIQGSIIGPNGRMLSTTLASVPAVVDVSDRDHFRVHLDGGFKGLFISTPVIGRISGRTTIQVTRRVDAPDGEFLGVIVFSLLPAQLSALHNAIDLHPRDMLIVAGAIDHIVRARFGVGSEQGELGVGEPIPPPPSSAGGTADAVAFFRDSVFDHVTRLHTVRYLSGFPLYVDVALDLEEVMRPAAAHARLIRSIGIIAALMLAGLMTALIVEIHRRTDREVKLGDEQERLAAEIRLGIQIQERLRASELRLRDFAETASDWFWEQDAELRFCAIKLEGRPLPVDDLSLFGKRRWEVNDTSEAPEQWLNHKCDLLARKPFRDFRFSRPAPAGKTQYVSINGVPVFDEAGVFVGYRGTGRDITAKVETETALWRAKESAEASNTAKSAFLATMSHELRTPLNAIIGFADLIHARKTGPITADYVEWAGDILASGRHLLDLINDVLELSRIEAGRYDLNDQTVDLAIVVRSCLPMIRRQAEQNRVRIVSTITGKSAIVRADQRAIKQVMLNLLTNAVKFTPTGGDVTIQVEATAAGELSLVVADTGIGIDPAVLPRLCEPFVQADASTSREYGGSGLGLAISTKIMALHGGALTVASALGEGTKVWITFPAERVLAAAREAQAAE